MSTITRITEIGDKIADRLQADNAKRDEEHQPSGKISGSKLGQPTLWAVLAMLGVPREFDPYLLGKFKRGHDVEARAVEFMTGIPAHLQSEKYDTWTKLDDSAILNGEVNLQMSCGYRNGVGYIDLAQRNDSNIILHEVKSSTKSSFDKVSASGRYRGTEDPNKGIGVPYVHHCIQLAYYCLGENADRGVLHYFNADDYRLTSFAINPQAYKVQIDKEIDDIEKAFKEHRLPVYEPFLPYHRAYKNSTYGEWNNLTEQQLMSKLKNEYPDSYKLFMEKG